MPLDVTARAEREFLAQCVSLPSAGAAALAAVDLDETFTSELTRRAARHLRAHLQSPTDGLDPEDTELATLIAQLAVRGAQRGGSAATLEGAALNLELVHLERAIATARSAGEGIAPLVTRRAELRRRRDRAIERAMAESQPVE